MTDVMSLKEAAKYLRVSYATILRMVRQREIPYMQVGRQYRVRLSDLDQWLVRQARKREFEDDES